MSLATKTHATVEIASNKDSGSVNVGTNLPKELLQNGIKPAEGSLALRVNGEQKARPVTYIMGSEAKGFSLCCKGSGPFPTNGAFTVEVLTNAE